jgi:hypothetical protein
MHQDDIQRFARLALEGVHRPYPYQVAHAFLEEGPLESPRSITPVFYGCYDWHSAVHGHWLIARARRLLSGTDFAEECSEALDLGLQAEPLSVEYSYLKTRPGFERPYGRGWLLALAGELDQHEDDAARSWREALRPVEEVVADSFIDWLPKLGQPVRSGTHNQTALGMGLAWDWAKQVGHQNMLDLLTERARTYFAEDHDYPLHLEPSGEDFVSASLGAGSVMSRMLEPDQFSAWFDRVMPTLGRGLLLQPATPLDRRDGRLVHLDGLNLSRAWMLLDIAAALPADDLRRDALQDNARVHAEAGLLALDEQTYAGTHWLGTFAMYLVDRQQLHA